MWWIFFYFDRYYQFSTRIIETSNLNNSDNILDSNFIDNDNLVNIVYNNSSLCKNLFKFLLGGRTLNENYNIWEWTEFYNCQIKPGDYSETPFLVATAAILNIIMSIAFSQQWALFGRFSLKTEVKYNHYTCIIMTSW